MLVASTDPAPSLADAFGVPLSSRPRRITGSRRQLFAVELDAAASFRGWITARQPLLESIAVNGTWLDDEDVARLIRLSLPGIDELAALFEIAVLARSSRFDHVVVDTAPTGHTLRMLALPATLAGVARVFDAMRDRRREVESALRGRWMEGPEDVLVGELAATAADLHALLRDTRRTRISWVTLPEALPVDEVMEAAAAMAAAGLTVGCWIVNRRTPRRRARCGHCEARVAIEARALKRLSADRPVVGISAHDDEPRGLEALSAIAAELTASRRPERPPRPAPRWRAALSGPAADAAALVEPATRLVMVAGKGGVGKSTCAAGLAIAAAERWPQRHVLLVSTDPAHSLAGVLGFEPGTERPLPDVPNLSVKELDASAAYATVRARYAAAIDSLFDREVGRAGIDARHDRQVMLQLLDLAPPGLDELAAILDIADTVSARGSERDVIVMDTAPTGHALRLLEMPALVHDWVRTLMSILLKYEAIAGLGSLAELLLDLSRRIGHLKALIADPDRTRVLVVSRGAALPRLETLRLLRRLGRLHVSVPVLLVNALGRGTCAPCRRQAAAETREVALLRDALRGRRKAPMLLRAPVHLPPPSGPAGLRRWTRSWRGDPAAPGPLRYHRTR